MTDQPIRVLVVDDHPLIRRGLCAEISLDPGMEVVGEAKDGHEAVELARTLHPDVILMDALMPRKNGIEATAEILRESPQVRVLILTNVIEDDRRLAGTRTGAKGHIPKDRSPEEVLQAIRDIHGGRPHLNPVVARRMLQEMRQPSKAAPEHQLTSREMEVLKWAARGVPSKEIALKIGVQEATIRAHVSKILSKLGLANRAQLVLYAVRKGWISQGDEQDWEAAQD